MDVFENAISIPAGVRTSVAVGKFDGVHLGHRLLIDRVVQEKENGLLPVVVQVQDPAETAHLLTESETVSVLSELGVGALVRLPLNDRLKNKEASDFMRSVLSEMLHARLVVAGDDFTFGKGRKGTTETLMTEGKLHGFETVVFKRLSVDGKLVSSNRIREALREGKADAAEALLGYPYALSGHVEHGSGFGHTYGVPTVNVRPDPGKALPRYGVYFTETVVKGRKLPSVTDIGIRPSVPSDLVPMTETHILDFSENLYGEDVTVLFHSFIREEKSFSSLKALQSAIQTDIETAGKRSLTIRDQSDTMCR